MKDMLSIIAEKGQKSDHIFKILPENSHWCLRERIDSEQLIEWNKECMLVIASILKTSTEDSSGKLYPSKASHLVLVIIRDSSTSNLDTNRLSIRIAPYVLWDQTTKDAWFGSDVSRKMSIIQIMIDNYHQIFGNDNIFYKCIDRRSEDLKTCADSINSSGKSPIMKEFLAGHKKTCNNGEKLKISFIPLQEEGPIGQNRTTTTYK
eukprot:XP_017452201.1 PREDICTED: uncharacterized protein LOC102556298 isoform X2 [Rattus norvegicus]